MANWASLQGLPVSASSAVLFAASLDVKASTRESYIRAISQVGRVAVPDWSEAEITLAARIFHKASASQPINQAAPIPRATLHKVYSEEKRKGNLQEAVIVLLMWLLAARSADLLALRAGDVFIPPGNTRIYFDFVGSKTRPRFAPTRWGLAAGELTWEAAAILSGIMSQRRDANDLLFTVQSTRISAILPPPYTLHSPRRGALQYLLQLQDRGVVQVTEALLSRLARHQTTGETLSRVTLRYLEGVGWPLARFLVAEDLARVL